jgi:uroporphyrin-III C-methyltransferase / precorrin-2 dehydrogenase / sirohydrochlorin ferrochelatase
MSPLAVLPVFFDLRGKRVVVAGDGEGAVWKAELLAAAGANVEVYAPEPSAELRALADAHPYKGAPEPVGGHLPLTIGSVRTIARGWRAADLPGAACAIGALEDAAGEAFARAAGAAGVPVNVVDTPGIGTFNFGTIVNRAPIAIGISTGGAAPVLGQQIRGKIEALLHPALGAWAARAKELRDVAKALLPMGAARRDLWRRYADLALTAKVAPTDADLEGLFDARPGAAKGSVVLVGAGPGDPELLTLKAVRALQSADVIMYDRLVGADILEFGRREARRILVGKTGGGKSCRQSDINDAMVALALEGKRVVRLKGGDPMVFGRANEEIDACRAAGVAVEVVPGITAASGAAAELRLSLTDRTAARRLQFVTGHAQDGRAPDYDWQLIADPWTTTVFYMGGRTFAEMLPRLIAAGLAAGTPAVAIAGATTRASRHVVTTAAGVPEALTALDAGQPCLIIVGRAVERLAAVEMTAVKTAETEAAAVETATAG